MTKSYLEQTQEKLDLAEMGKQELLEELRGKYAIYQEEQAKLSGYTAKRDAAKALSTKAERGYDSLLNVEEGVASLFAEAKEAAEEAFKSANGFVVGCENRIKVLGLTEAKIAWMQNQLASEQLPERIKAASKGLGKRYGMYYPVAGKILAGEKATSPLGRRAANHKSTEKEQGALAKLCAVEEAIAANGLPNKLEVRDQLISALEVQITEHRAKVRKVAPQNAGRSTMSIKDQQVEIEYSAGKCYAS